MLKNYSTSKHPINSGSTCAAMPTNMLFMSPQTHIRKVYVVTVAFALMAITGRSAAGLTKGTDWCLSVHLIATIQCGSSQATNYF